MMSETNVIPDLEQRGFAVVSGVLSRQETQAWTASLEPATGAGRRGLLSVPQVAALAHSEKMLGLLRPHLPEEPRAVRGICFDKSLEANWLVPWHQDLSLAVRERIDVPGFRPWSIKDGVPHVQPPLELLERMLTVRLHLDDADETNGALRVLPCSHRLGRLSAERIQKLRKETPEEICAVRAGDALLMRPLLLHASGRSTAPSHRRVLHLEYAAFALPDGLQWMEI